MIQISPAVKHLLFINILVFLGALLLARSGMVPDIQSILALHYPGSDLFKPFQIVTHFFMHDLSNLFHLFFNMFALVMFGSILEMHWGSNRFLLFYIVCALGSALLHTLFNYIEISPLQHALAAFQASPDLDTFWAYFNKTGLADLPENADAFREMSAGIRSGSADAIAFATTQMQTHLKMMMDGGAVGASGAISGLLVAFGMMFPNAPLMLIFLPVPVKAKYFIPALLLVEVFLARQQYAWDNIAHYAHLGGALTGFLLILYWRRFGKI
ncbi:MAG TPA: rhomboid family intramembrane serine protease [Flavilitoribacter sp.]|nr:rhomboid family intramembrane serine protease [Lewinella sp.]MCB9282039.1 rhomboid family intramembrane serine protease [Lewinellaceae bacterium]HMQ61471.1 rhomboid family intramembrane serine protease [Flavilitoribacter sp.]HMQ88073.1 rhomboid family intramembrane serine protease [Flavilitoribacter sp.]